MENRKFRCPNNGGGKGKTTFSKQCGRRTICSQDDMKAPHSLVPDRLLRMEPGLRPTPKKVCTAAAGALTPSRDVTGVLKPRPFLETGRPGPLRWTSPPVPQSWPYASRVRDAEGGRSPSSSPPSAQVTKPRPWLPHAGRDPGAAGRPRSQPLRRSSPLAAGRGPGPSHGLRELRIPSWPQAAASSARNVLHPGAALAQPDRPASPALAGRCRALARGSRVTARPARPTGPRAAEASRGAILTTGAMAAAEAERELGALRRRKESSARRARRAQAATIAPPRPSASPTPPWAAHSGSDCFSLNANSVLSRAGGVQGGARGRAACPTARHGGRLDEPKEK